MSRIKGVLKIDSPREKLERYGPEKLTDSELLALLLGSGIKGLNVLQLANRILRLIEKTGIEKMTLGILLKEKGLGRAKSAQILALLSLGKRLYAKGRPEVLNPKDTWKLCADFRDSKREHFVAFYLDTQEALIERQVISIGTLDASLVHPRELFEPAISLHAASIIVAHNHPSGSLEPSSADIEITKRLVHSGKVLGIPIRGHVIVTGSEVKEIDLA